MFYGREAINPLTLSLLYKHVTSGQVQTEKKFEILKILKI